MSQKTLMPMHAFSSPCPVRLLRDLSFALGVFALGFVTAILVMRAPLSAPMSDLDLKSEILAGSDALLERMVIPPNRPDWVVMNCSDTAAAASQPQTTAYDRMRHTLCETARKQTVASFQF